MGLKSIPPSLVLVIYVPILDLSIKSACWLPGLALYVLAILVILPY